MNINIRTKCSMKFSWPIKSRKILYDWHTQLIPHTATCIKIFRSYCKFVIRLPILHADICSIPFPTHINHCCTATLVHTAAMDMNTLHIMELPGFYYITFSIETVIHISIFDCCCYKRYLATQ